MLLRESAKVGGTGLLVGLTLALMIARALVGTLYGVSFDAWLFVVDGGAAGAGDPGGHVAAGPPRRRASSPPSPSGTSNR